MNDTLIREILDLEWEMFSAVNNGNDRASCQEDKSTFDIMRASQAEAWTEQVLQSYLNDLVQAQSQRRNLMTEKYARMMETTVPDAYQRIASRLPVVDAQTLDRIEKIIEINLQWKAETAAKYPNLTRRGRAIYTKDDSALSTSFETYLRGELRTFSPETIRRYYAMTLEYVSRGENIEDVYLLNTVKKYGYASLEQAERLSA